MSESEINIVIASEGGQAVSDTPTQQTFSHSDVRKIICERDKEWFQVIESILGFHPVTIAEALEIGISRIKNKNDHIKRLDETLEAVTDKLDNAWGIYMEFKETKP